MKLCREAIFLLGIAACGGEPKPANSSSDSVALLANDAKSHGSSLKEGEDALLKGDHAKARQLFEVIVAKEPKNAEAHSYLASAFEGLSDQASAETHFKHALSLKPNLLHALINYSALLIDAKRYAEAKALLSQPFVAKLGAHELTFSLGLAETAVGLTAEGERHFRAAIAQAPTVGSYHLALAQVLHEEKKDEEALRELELACRHAGQDVTLWMELGTTFRAMRKARECADALGRALSLKDEPRVRFDRATCLLAAKDFDVAASELEQLAKASPDHAIVQYWLGVAYSGAGKKDEAKKRFRDYLQRDPKGAKAKEAEAQLKELR